MWHHKVQHILIANPYGILCHSGTFTLQVNLQTFWTLIPFSYTCVVGSASKLKMKCSFSSVDWWLFCDLFVQYQWKLDFNVCEKMIQLLMEFLMDEEARDFYIIADTVGLSPLLWSFFCT